MPDLLLASKCIHFVDPLLAQPNIPNVLFFRKQPAVRIVDVVGAFLLYNIDRGN